MIFGISAIILSLIIIFWTSSEANKPVFMRRMIFNDKKFILTVNIIAIFLFVGGLILTALSSLVASLCLIILVVLFFIYMRYTGSPKATYKVIKDVYIRFKQMYPEEPEEFILLQVLQSRYPEWPPYKYDQLLRECSNLKDLSNNIIYIETGKFPDQSIY